MKKLISIILLSLAITLLAACALFEAEEKVFEKSGLSITLTEDFAEKEHVSYTGVYQSQNVAVYTLKEELSLLNISSNATLSDYAKLVIKANKLTSEIETKDELTYFTFEKEVNGKNVSYYAFVYKANDAFWLVQIACESDKASEYEEDIFKYAKSVDVE